MATVIGGSIYVIGGHTGSGRSGLGTYRFDADASVWTTLTPPPDGMEWGKDDFAQVTLTV